MNDFTGANHKMFMEILTTLSSFKLQDAYIENVKLLLIIMNDFTGANHELFLEILTFLYSF